MEPQTADAMQFGTYTEWKGLNECYELQGLDHRQSQSAYFVYVTLKGIYDPVMLADQYGRLPGVLGADPRMLTANRSTCQVAL